MDYPEGGGEWNLLGGYYKIIVSKRSLEMWTWKFTGTKRASKEIIKVSLMAKQLGVPGLPDLWDESSCF